MRLGFKSPSIRRVTRGGDRDPAADEKDQAESEWQTELYKLFQGQIARIQAALEPAIPADRKAIRNPLDDDFWSNEEKLFLAAIIPLMTEAALDGIAAEAALLEASFGISIDWTLANTAAAEWARANAAELVAGITETTASNVAGTIANWIGTPGSTVGQLFETLRRSYAFSEGRAQAIAVTEVTNSYAEGNELANIEAGIPPTVYRPTAHPRCRCWTTAVLLANNVWVIVWRTNEDELVCKRPIDTGTALGTVAGCRWLANRVISADMLGERLSDARRMARKRE